MLAKLAAAVYMANPADPSRHIVVTQCVFASFLYQERVIVFLTTDRDGAI